MAVGRGARVHFPSLFERRDRCEQGRGSGERGEGAHLRNVRGRMHRHWGLMMSWGKGEVKTAWVVQMGKWGYTNRMARTGRFEEHI